MHRRTVAAALSTAILLGVAGPAAAQSTTAPPASTTAPATTTPPTPVPAKGTLKLTLEKVNGKASSVLAGDRFRVRGTVKPYIPGQKVVVRFYRGEKKIAAKTVAVLSSKRGNGYFVLGYK